MNFIKNIFACLGVIGTLWYLLVFAFSDYSFVRGLRVIAGMSIPDQEIMELNREVLSVDRDLAWSWTDETIARYERGQFVSHYPPSSSNPSNVLLSKDAVPEWFPKNWLIVGDGNSPELGLALDRDGKIYGIILYLDMKGILFLSSDVSGPDLETWNGRNILELYRPENRLYTFTLRQW